MSATQPRFLAEHHGIADAINAGDPALARQLAYEHMQLIVDIVAHQSPGLLDHVIEWR
jgi:DNA-binding GntR family transcriptional regulator